MYLNDLMLVYLLLTDLITSWLKKKTHKLSLPSIQGKVKEMVGADIIHLVPLHCLCPQIPFSCHSCT